MFKAYFQNAKQKKTLFIINLLEYQSFFLFDYHSLIYTCQMIKKVKLPEIV